MKLISDRTCRTIERLLSSGAWRRDGTDRERNMARMASKTLNELKKAKSVWNTRNHRTES